ncbi:hypothetical protein MTO96_017222 [Rhipicephalus appendiculatus]
MRSRCRCRKLNDRGWGQQHEGYVTIVRCVAPPRPPPRGGADVPLLTKYGAVYELDNESDVEFARAVNSAASSCFESEPLERA